MRAAVGKCDGGVDGGFLAKAWRRTAAQPATKGVAILVPASYLNLPKGHVVSWVDLDHLSGVGGETGRHSSIISELNVPSRPDNAPVDPFGDTPPRRKIQGLSVSRG
jgi:hypothetical protein